jgi:DNA polymerase I-like protein with 3'-5' exonuclease and polymerase domains
MHSLDLETSTKDGDLSNGYALEPWRARQGLARISSIHVHGDKINVHLLDPTREQLIDILKQLKGEETFAHFATFDVAWLIASIEPNRLARVPQVIMDVKWRDTALLAKWCCNGRKADDMFFSYSLANLIYTWRDRLGYEGALEFVRMKQEAPNSGNDQYWEERGKLDTLWTYRLAKWLKAQLPEPCRRGFLIEQRAIPRIANSWLIGMYVDAAALDVAEAEIETTIQQGCIELGLPESVISSPAQLGRVVFGQWGYKPLALTKTGQPQADADTWIILAHAFDDPRLRKLLKVRQAITLRSKYIYVAREALGRTMDGYLYGKPNLFGTSSGRLTYSSETTRGLKVSIAQHQIPRKDKIIRRYLAPPPGAALWESDAAAQESRIMGIWSQDPEIIRIFNDGTNFHSFTASKIYGVAYEEMQAHYEAGESKFIEWRQMGKLTNLSCNFRIGGKSLAKKALTEYDTYMSEDDGKRLTRTWINTYSGVRSYWNSIIAFAKQNGYSYTLAHRRYKVPLEMMNSGDSWKVEGTVISHPIQGTGGEMFLAAIDQVPDARIQTSLHDGIFWLVDEGPAGQEEADYILDKINNTPYEDMWGMEQPMPIKLMYEGTKIGRSYADVK